MIFFIISVIVVFYVIGIIVYMDIETMDRNARIGLLWPVLFIFLIIRVVIWLLNNLLKFILLIFNYKYNETKIYRCIDVKFG